MAIIQQLSAIFHDKILFFILINFIMLIVLVYFNRKYLKNFFLKIDKKTWVLLFLVFIFALSLRIFLPSHHHRMWTDEAVYMETGKNILQTFSQGSYSRSIGWPFLLSIIFGIFGVSNWAALYTSTILGTLTIFNIFFLTFIITKQKYLSLISALIFSLFVAHIVWSASAETNVPSLFFATLTLFFSFLYYRLKKISLLWLALVSLAFTAQIRPENYIFPVLFLFGCILFDKQFFRKINFKFILPWLILLLLSSPNLVVNLHTHTSTNFIENDTQGMMVGNNFGISNLINNSLTFGKYVFNTEFQPVLVTFLFLAGLIYMFYKAKKEAVFLITWFCFLWFVYFFSWFQTLGGGTDLFSKTRFFMMFYPITVIFMGYGILLIKNKVPEKIKKFQLKKKIFLATALMIVIFSIPYLIKNDLMFYSSAHRLETRIPELAEKDIPNNCIIIANHPEILKSTTNLNAINIDDFLINPDNIFNNTSCLLFFEDYYCLDFDSHNSKEKCKTIKNRYKMQIYKIYNEGTIKQFRFYKITSPH